MKTYDLIVSLGEACSCSETLRLCNLQDFSYPFDWVYGSNLVDRVKILTSRFENFLRKDDLIYSHVVNSISCDAYHNNFNDITFNHDFPVGVSLDESFPEVKAKYERRINRLFEKIEQAQSVLFVHMELSGTTNKFGKDKILMKLQNDLQEAFPATRCDLLYLKHLAILKPNRIIRRNIGRGVDKVIYYNRALDSKAPDWAFNSDNSVEIFKNYELKKQNVDIKNPVF